MSEQLDVAQQVIAVIADQLSKEVDEVKPESHLGDDLGADSLDATELIMNLEERFEISIPEDDAKDATTVQKVIDVVEAALAKSD